MRVSLSKSEGGIILQSSILIFYIYVGDTLGGSPLYVGNICVFEALLKEALTAR